MRAYFPAATDVTSECSLYLIADYGLRVNYTFKLNKKFIKSDENILFF